MKRGVAAILIIMFTSMIPSSLAEDEPMSVLARGEIAEDGRRQVLIEWFCDTDSTTCREFEQDHALLRDRDTGHVWLSWHPSDPDDPLGSMDSTLRADELDAYSPAVRVDFQRLEGIDDGDGFIAKRAGLALNGTVPEAGGDSLVDLPLEVSLLDGDGDDIVDEIEVIIEVLPRVDLASDVILNLVLVEWHPDIRTEGPRPAHVVREWTATAAFSRMAMNSTSLRLTFGEEHLEAAGVRIDADDANRWGIVAFIAGHEAPHGSPAGSNPAPGTPSTVLGITEMDLPTMWEGTSAREAGPRLGFLLFSLICIGIIIMTERQRELALPRITGRIRRVENGNLVAVIDVQIGRHPAELQNIGIEPPWRMRNRPRMDNLKAGSERTLEIGLKNEEEVFEPVRMNFSMDVETFGGWIMDLHLTPPKIDTVAREEE